MNIKPDDDGEAEPFPEVEGPFLRSFIIRALTCQEERKNSRSEDKQKVTVLSI